MQSQPLTALQYLLSKIIQGFYRSHRRRVDAVISTVNIATCLKHRDGWNHFVLKVIQHILTEILHPSSLQDLLMHNYVHFCCSFIQFTPIASYCKLVI